MRSFVHSKGPLHLLDSINYSWPLVGRACASGGATVRSVRQGSQPAGRPGGGQRWGKLCSTERHRGSRADAPTSRGNEQKYPLRSSKRPLQCSRSWMLQASDLQ